MKNFNFNPGVIEDPRPEEEKQRDFKHEEIASAVALNWNKKIEDAPKYFQKDQNGGSYCVGEGSSTGLETIEGVVLSAMPIYRRRMNYPGLGMYLQDAGDIVHDLTRGTSTEVAFPSQKLSEEQTKKEINVPTPYNGYSYFFVNVQDIEAIAQAIEVRKHCVLTINGTLEEYANVEKPIVIPSNKLNCAHCICGVFYFKDENGVKCILAKESWGPDSIKFRILTEDYLKARGTGAMYFVKPVPTPTPIKPKFIFQTILLYGQSNYSIKMLQDILKYEGLFPLNVSSTGNYLSVTAKGVLAWQIKHKVASMEELNSLQGKRVGAKTIAALNLIYSK